ncbi:carbohydrate-binding protein, partial [Streptacidiphilus sp. N1-3]
PANAVGAYVQIPVTATTAGTKTLSFRYSDGTTAARPATITVNGTSRGTLNFPVTANWDTWSTATISVPLNAGANPGRVTGTVADGPANIDSVTVSQ